MPLLLEQAGKGLDIIDRRAYETAGQGLERLLLRRLSSSRKRCEGSSMEAAVKDHDGARSAIERLLDFGIVCSCGTGGLFGVLASIQASKLDSALVCFGSGVCIERLPRLGACRIPTIEQPGDFTGKLATALDVVVIAHVDQALGLVLQSLGDDWMAMTETAHADARDEVEICIALGIFDFHALAGNELDGLTSKRMHHILRFKFLLLL